MSFEALNNKPVPKPSPTASKPAAPKEEAAPKTPVAREAAPAATNKSSVPTTQVADAQRALAQVQINRSQAPTFDPATLAKMAEGLAPSTVKGLMTFAGKSDSMRNVAEAGVKEEGIKLSPSGFNALVEGVASNLMDRQG